MQNGRFNARNASQLASSERHQTGRTLLLAGSLVALVQTPVAAQQPVAADPGKSYFMEYAVVTVLIAAAVFAVGRSSRRG